eukprot:TRINITY_DN2085_c0_g1_i1.p1 TRINITY_DN2085_c0_g1~~TRINITY_DN2085_c0_g1_i1.p1  ORF type:complete len:650 (+),score=165.79 TRINITY_DN2085_c0_g1_i1:108-2057(+)
MGAAFERECGCGPRSKRPDGVYFRYPEAEPTRTCLPQVDPLHAERRAAVRAAADGYALRRCLQAGRAGGRRGSGGAGVGAEWPVLLPDPLPDCEQPTAHFRDALDYQAQVVEALRTHLGDSVAALFHRPEHWQQARLGLLPGVGVGSGGTAPGAERWASFAEAEAPFASEERLSGFPVPHLAKRWMDDVAFSQLRLVGPNASSLWRVASPAALPPGFRLDEEAFLGRIENHPSLAAACAAGRIFAVDYSAALRRCAQRHASGSGTSGLCNPVALFYSANNRQLCPLCIQLHVAPHDGDIAQARVYTPDESTWSWALAKMCFNQADLHYHLICNLYTETVMAGGVAHAVTCRTLSPHHPLRQLLRPHLLGCLAAAERWHKTLFEPLESDPSYSALRGCLSIAPAEVRGLAADAWARFRLADAGIVADCARRLGPAAESALTGKYPYREDGERLWRALEDHVREVLGRYYVAPESFTEDSELCAWLQELRLLGSEVSPADGLEPLVGAVTAIIFLCSAQYRARTEGLYETFACFAAFPGRPGGPVPTEMGPDELAAGELVCVLPTKRDSVAQVAVCYVLSGRGASEPPEGWQLADFAGQDLFVDRSACQVAAKLKDRVAEVASAVSERNAALEVPYRAFHPEHIRNSFGTH